MTTTAATNEVRNLSMRTLAERNKGMIDRKSDGFYVHPSLIKHRDGFNTRNYDTPRTQAHIDNIAHAFMKGEFVEPITVRIVGDQIEAVEGHCRHMGAMRAIEKGASIERMKVNIFDGDDLAARLHIGTSNDKLALAPTERARNYRNMLDEFGISQSQLAERLGKTQGHISQVLKLLTLPESIIELIDSGDLSASEALKQAAAVTRSAKDAGAESDNTNDGEKEALNQLGEELKAKLDSAKKTKGDKAKLTGKVLKGKSMAKPLPAKKVAPATPPSILKAAQSLALEMEDMSASLDDGKATVTMSATAWETLMTLVEMAAEENEVKPMAA